MVFVSSRAVAPEVVRPPTLEVVELDFDHDIELVLAFLNTCDAEDGTETLDDHDQWKQWCADRGLGAAPDVEAAREIRDSMRSAVSYGVRPPGLATAWPVQVRLQRGIPVLAGTDALGTVLVAAARLVHTEHWERIKICPADDCLWAFYDRSRNRSRTWCSMRVCGNREKARSWRERHTTA
ncbi:Putative stress-induced transcription regulator [Saccharopolyspora kobensis]|uniref:Stress-induced transcription regulator n=1 Tax=Saccharopolyspora kobensis TaxID=146035 RepID=A0A1H6DYK4_9PSEU|nr:CGNR zinc finger domain-containing protein [Saccharopolyspora kobensis]SEG90219.1 Putative stress-induced transcription regulator [Saccharopolyspora kobensis]SFD89673.1 Putative stress-induced transcription regulator [Saccharopolyspora kobensis]